MKRVIICLTAFVTLGILNNTCYCLEITKDQAMEMFTLANDEYKNSHKLMSAKKTQEAIDGFKNAADQYEKLIQSGYLNGQIYYNLANSHYRQGNAGKAMLYYNKALKLMPRNSELKENIKLVNSEFEDKSLTKKAPGVLKAVFFWYFLFNLNETTAFALSFYIVFMICMLVFIFLRYEWIKKLCAWFGAAMIVTGITLGIKIYTEQVNLKGIVVSKECNVRYGPGEEYEPKFLIHEGAQFLVEDENDKWYKVYVYVDVKQPDETGEDEAGKEGKTGWIGWIPKEKVGII